MDPSLNTRRRRRRMPIGPRTLPAEIESEILLRLPVKTLKRFQCVSKPWYSLISSPQFQKDHFRRAQQRSPLLLTLRHDELDQTFDDRLLTYNNNADYALSSEKYKTSGIDPFTFRFSTYNDQGALVKKFSVTLPYPFTHTNMIHLPFMQSCLGLVLLSSRHYPPILVCNPSTEEIISLPPTQERHFCVGFGYIPSTEEFKVVRFFYHNDNEFYYESSDGRTTCCCEVFTLGTSDWRPARTPPPYNVYRHCAPFLHGALHVLPYITYRHVQATDYVAAFDIEREVYNARIPLPDYYYTLGDTRRCDPSSFTCLTKLGGSLCLTFDFGEGYGRVDMWILKDYNKVEWVRAHNINIFPVCPYPTYLLLAYPVEAMDNESILINVSDEGGVKLLHYDPREELITVKIDKESAATVYKESFYTLHGAGGLELNTRKIADTKANAPNRHLEYI